MARASWLVSTPTPVFIPRPLLPDPTHSREPGVGGQRLGRLGSSGNGSVGVGRTRGSDSIASSTNAIPRAGAGFLEGGCLIWVPVSQRHQPHVAETLRSPSCPPGVSSRDGGAAGRAGEGAPGEHRRALRRRHSADCKPYGNSPSRKAVQTPAHTISKQGLGREARRGLHRLE